MQVRSKPKESSATVTVMNCCPQTEVTAPLLDFLSHSSLIRRFLFIPDRMSLVLLHIFFSMPPSPLPAAEIRFYIFPHGGADGRLSIFLSLEVAIATTCQMFIRSRRVKTFISDSHMSLSS